MKILIIKDKLLKPYLFIEKYIKGFYHRIKYQFNKLQTGMVNFHFWCQSSQVYTRSATQILTILLNGFFIWVMLFPLITHNPVWYIPSYGIIPWFVINFIREIKE